MRSNYSSTTSSNSGVPARLARLLDRPLGRWLPLLFVVLVWYYSIMVTVMNADVLAGFTALLLAVWVLTTACLAYAKMRKARRSHPHIWRKIGGFLVVTLAVIVAKPWLGIIGTSLATFLAWFTFYSPNTSKQAEEGAFIMEDATAVARKLEKQQAAVGVDILQGVKLKGFDDAPIADTATPALPLGGAPAGGTGAALATTVGAEQALSVRAAGQIPPATKSPSKADLQAILNKVPGFPFGGIIVPWLSATKNILFAGIVGSGKSVSITLIQAAVFHLMQFIAGMRVLVYDPKTQMPTTLNAQGIDYINANPFDRRCRAWNVSADVRTASQAMAAAALIAPDRKESDPFWTKCVRIYLVAVMRYFNETAPGQFRLRDVLLATRNMTLIHQMMEDSPKLQHYTQVAGSEKTAQNISSSMVCDIADFEVIAALWHKAETVYGSQPFSLTSWAKGESEPVLVIARSTVAAEALEAINRMMLTRVIQLLLAGPASKFPLIWLFVDELGSLGGFKPFATAITELRERGAVIVAGIQAVTQLVENFNENVANTIAANFGHVAALRLSDPKTETFMRETAGKVRYAREVVSKTRSHRQGTSYSVTTQYGEEDVLRPGELSSIEEFDPALGTGLRGYYRSGANKWWNTYPPDIVGQLPPRGDQADNFIPMPEEYQELEPWTYDDYVRLGITHLYSGPIDVESQGEDVDSHWAIDGGSSSSAQEIPAAFGAGDDSASDFLEQQFARFEEEYGVTFDGDGASTPDSDALDDDGAAIP